MAWSTASKISAGVTGWPMLFLTHAIADTTAARGFRRILPDRDPRGRQCTTRDSSRARRSATSSAFGSPRSTGGSGPDDSPPRCASARGRCAGASRKSPAGSSRWKGPNPRPRDKSRAAALGRDIRNPRVLMHGPATCAPELEPRRERRVSNERWVAHRGTPAATRRAAHFRPRAHPPAHHPSVLG